MSEADALPSSRAHGARKVRQYRCCRKPYYAAWAVAVFMHQQMQRLACHSLLTTSTSSADASLLTTKTIAMKQFMRDTCGVPASVAHEGPLNVTHLHAVQALLSDALVDQVRAQTYNGALCATPCAQLARLWPAAIRTRYVHELLAVRQANMQLSKAGMGHPQYEAGLTALRVLAGVDRASVESTATPASTSVLREWAALIDAYTLFLPDRSCVHELENLPQEIAIGELVADCVRRVRMAESGFALRAVVDVGGGNGFLAAQLAERLDCDGLVVDPYYPSHAIDCGPRRWPDTQHRVRPAHARRRTLQRHMAFFKDTLWARDIGCSPAHTALVAKHLCGSAVDECLSHLRAQHCLPRILILAPCCFSKIDTQTYCNADFLRTEMGIDSQEAFARLTRLTDWNVSCYGQVYEIGLLQKRRGADRQAAGCTLNNLNDTQRALVALDHCDGDASSQSPPHRFAGGGRSIARQVPCMHAFSQYVEALVNEGRVRWLRAQGYDAQVVQYVPACVTPKNKCIVAVRAHTMRHKGRCKL